MCYFIFCKIIALPTNKSSKIEWDKISTIIYFMNPLVINIITKMNESLGRIINKSIVIYILVVVVTIILSIVILRLKDVIKKGKENLSTNNYKNRI